MDDALLPPVTLFNSKEDMKRTESNRSQEVERPEGSLATGKSRSPRSRRSQRPDGRLKESAGSHRSLPDRPAGSRWLGPTKTPWIEKANWSENLTIGENVARLVGDLGLDLAKRQNYSALPGSDKGKSEKMRITGIS